MDRAHWVKVALLLNCIVSLDCAHLQPMLPLPLPPPGLIPPNRRYDKSFLRETRHRLPPGTLTSESSVIALDVTRLCFDVVLRALEIRPDLASFQGWHIYVVTMGEPAVRIERPEIYPVSWDDAAARSFAASESVPTAVLRGTVCFPNRSEVNYATPGIRLRVEDPKADALSRQYASFEWTMARGVLKPAGER